jgi:hypothetical protein
MKRDNDLQIQIKNFISYFTHKYEMIKNSKFKESDELFKKIFYVGIIDALAKTVFPKRGNRERFVEFIRTFSDWENSERISLPHLKRLLDFTPEPEYTGIRKFVISKHNQWIPPNIISLTNDPEYKEIIKYWPKAFVNSQIIEGIKLESIQHVHLFYSYRNSLVHEIRNIGYGIEEVALKNEPSYHHMDTLNGEKTWELVYPLGFFENICESCIGNLEKYLITRELPAC